MFLAFSFHTRTINEGEENKTIDGGYFMNLNVLMFALYDGLFGGELSWVWKCSIYNDNFKKIMI